MRSEKLRHAMSKRHFGIPLFLYLVLSIGTASAIYTVSYLISFEGQVTAVGGSPYQIIFEGKNLNFLINGTTAIEIPAQDVDITSDHYGSYDAILELEVETPLDCNFTYGEDWSMYLGLYLGNPPSRDWTKITSANVVIPNFVTIDDSYTAQYGNMNLKINDINPAHCPITSGSYKLKLTKQV